MSYSVYEKKAICYLEERYGGVDVITKYNKSIEEKLHEYMLKFFLEQYPDDIKKAMNLNKAYEKRFISKYRG